jgi:hypothetical protein
VYNPTPPSPICVQYVNFDQEIFQLIREAKCLVKLDIAIPEEAKIILLQEESFKVRTYNAYNMCDVYYTYLHI